MKNTICYGRVPPSRGGILERNKSDSSKRIEERAPVNFQVDFIHEGDYVLSFSKNISLGGMFLCTQDPPEPGRKVKLIFPVEEYYHAEVMAIVVWNNRSANVGERGMGVQFLSPLSSHLKENIMKDIKRVEILKEHEGFA
jgi:c-di-GMP-binding flagellar brake protein YcgR